MYICIHTNGKLFIRDIVLVIDVIEFTPLHTPFSVCRSDIVRLLVREKVIGSASDQKQRCSFIHSECDGEQTMRRWCR